MHTEELSKTLVAAGPTKDSATKKPVSVPVPKIAALVVVSIESVSRYARRNNLFSGKGKNVRL